VLTGGPWIKSDAGGTALILNGGPSPKSNIYLNAKNVTIQNGNLTFSNSNGRIQSASNLYLDAYNTWVSSYLTLGGVSRNTWPECPTPSLSCYATYRDDPTGAKDEYQNIVYCDSGYTITGGGTTDLSSKQDDAEENRPYGNGWMCQKEGPTRCYVVCCKISVS